MKKRKNMKERQQFKRIFLYCRFKLWTFCFVLKNLRNENNNKTKKKLNKTNNSFKIKKRKTHFSLEFYVGG